VTTNIKVQKEACAEITYVCVVLFLREPKASMRTDQSHLNSVYMKRPILTMEQLKTRKKTLLMFSSIIMKNTGIKLDMGLCDIIM